MANVERSPNNNKGKQGLRTSRDEMWSVHVKTEAMRFRHVCVCSRSNKKQLVL